MTDQGCLFCRIVSREIPSEVVYQDEGITSFRDINPQAPVHVVIVPNEHIASTNDLRPEHDAAVGALIRAASSMAETLGVRESGYRLVSNCGAQAGQSVWHLHVHLLGGRRLAWPPG